MPDFKVTANLTYNYGPFSAFIQGRYIDDGKLENALTEGVDIESNEVDSAFYLDLRLGYVHQFSDRSSVEVYATVTNVLDEDPPITPYYSVFLGYAEQYNPRLFDLLGRRYVGGVRIRF